MKRLLVSIAVLLLASGALHSAESGSGFGAPHASAIEPMRSARDAIDRLNRMYWSPVVKIWFATDDLHGYFDGRNNPPWWPSANAVELLIDYMNAAGVADFDADLAALYELQKDASKRNARLVAELKRRGEWTERDAEAMRGRTRKEELRREAGTKAETDAASNRYYTDFQNEYLDDSAWWGIAWLKMYDRTKDPKYLATARVIHAHMAKSWRPDKGGGILWCEDNDKQQPNAITNSLFVILSARLATRTSEPGYAAWAEKTMEWMQTVKLYNGIAVVDAPGHKDDYWSYNQGAYIGALSALYQETGKRLYLDEAAAVAKSALEKGGFALPNGIIVEKIGAGGDAALFKGVFVRYLGQLHAILSKLKLDPVATASIERCIQTSAAAIRKHAADSLAPAEWQDGAKDTSVSFNSQLSAAIALLAAADSQSP